MFAQDMLFRLRHKLFDARDVMVTGLALFAGALVLLPHSPTQAHVSYSGPINLDAGVKSMTTENTAVPAALSPDRPVSVLSERARRQMFGLFYATPVSGTRSSELARQAALTGVSLPERKPGENDKIAALQGGKKGKTCTGLVTFDEDGKVKLLSPCVESILTGDFENLPQRATSFFIDAMNDPAKKDKVPEVAINSFLAMMEAMAASVEKEEKEEAAAKAAAEKKK